MRSSFYTPVAVQVQRQQRQQQRQQQLIEEFDEIKNPNERSISRVLRLFYLFSSSLFSLSLSLSFLSLSLSVLSLRPSHFE